MGIDVTLYAEVNLGHKDGHSRFEVYSSNMTHNISRMCEEAGIEPFIWYPEDNGITLASHLIQPLREAIALMESDPPRFEKLNPKNGWGDYKHTVIWLKDILNHCEEYPLARYESYR